MKEAFHGPLAMVSHSLHTPVLYLAVAGVVTAWVLYVKAPHLPAKIASAFSPIYKLLDNKYYLDTIYYNVFAKGSRALGNFFWKVGDIAIIDNGIVNNSAKLVGAVSARVRKMQTSFIYTYATVMVFGLLVLIAIFFKDLLMK